jgi:hypothetical protein
MTHADREGDTVSEQEWPEFDEHPSRMLFGVAFNDEKDWRIVFNKEQYNRARLCVNALSHLSDDLVRDGGFASVPLETHRALKACNAALEQQRGELQAKCDGLLYVLKKCKEALEPYDDLKPRDWKTDREKLALAHATANAAIAKAQGDL